MTAPAQGIHAHPSKKIGVRPEDTSRAKVAIGPFLQAGSTPVYPPSDEQPNFTYPMDRNDQAGDCVDAGGDHLSEVVIKTLTGTYTNWSDAVLLKNYQSQNPGFTSWADAEGPNDNGMNIAEFLDYGIKQGYWLAYGAIDYTNTAEMKAAIDIGLGIITGETLDVAQQDGKTWDYVPASSQWGGHCTVWTGYNADPEVVTWGEDDYTMTEAFVTHQVTEAYFVLFQAHVDHPTFRDNFDLAGFAAAISQITDGKVVVPVTPTPTPAPTPTPVPDPFPPQPPVPNPPVPPTPPAPIADAASQRFWSTGGRAWLTGHVHHGINAPFARLLEEWALAEGLPVSAHVPEHGA